LISALGNDLPADIILKHCSSCNMEIRGFVRIEEYRTAIYCASVNNAGELFIGVVDTEIFLHLTWYHIAIFEKDFLSSDWIILDSNITVELMDNLLNFCAKSSLNIFYEPTSSEKSIKILQCNGLAKVAVIAPSI